MKSKPVVPRKQAERDIDAAFEDYLSDGGTEVALAFTDALERAMLHIFRHPASGSPRYAHELNLPGLRHWQLKGFPYLIFYMEMDARIEVWRILHGQRDIPASIQKLE
jgi:toxin ParE1/3/4